MKKLVYKILMLTIVVAAFNSTSANNITVTNASLTGRNTTAGTNNAANYALVQFDISWENSWRTSSAPYNSDAAWVFVKYRVSGGAWSHATLNYTGHTAPTGSTITPATDGTGAFIYRSADGTGTFSKAGIQLRWNYGVNGVADNATVDVQVFAIEMVFVPTGAFALGSGGTAGGAFYKYPTTTNTYPVSSEDAITVGTAADNLYSWTSTNSGDQTGPIPAAFPKGYSAFYCMKYEISQQGYVDFLNTLTYTQQVNRTANAPSSIAGTGALITGNGYRNGINIMTEGVSSTTSAVYACNLNGNTSYSEADDGQNIACNYLSWADVAAYLDWSGLRPMTELEFEKACRGTVAAVAYEYAWGTIGIAGSAYTLSNNGSTNEVIATYYSTTVGNAAYGTTTPYSGVINGPVRAGIFAGTNGNTGRVTAGATYYGIMEMSGNLYERPVTVGNATGRGFTGTHGNGLLDASGIADASTWPGDDAVGAGTRGGVWNDNAVYMQISDRYTAAYTYNSRGFISGGRGVRTASFDNLASDPLMVPVASGTFTAGSTLVAISSFKIDKYEVTYELWTAVKDWGLTHGYTDLVAGTNGKSPVGANNPVTTVNWYDVIKWCNARSEKDGLTPVYYTTSGQDVVYRTGETVINTDAVKWAANGYRLPTEAEWEFAAKGGTLAQSTPYTYSGSNTIGDVAWYSANSGTATHSVGTKSANELGIYDMSGNAWEWCWDWYGWTYPSGGTTDPKGPSPTLISRLYRGGSFNDPELDCRVFLRYGISPTNRYNSTGFRCVQD